MVTRNIIVSDLSGEEHASTVTLGFGSEWRAVDLTEAERAELDGVLRPYMAVSRPAQTEESKSNRYVPKTTLEERIEIRRWGNEHDYEVAERGMIPNRVYRAYQSAHDGGRQ